MTEEKPLISAKNLGFSYPPTANEVKPSIFAPLSFTVSAGDSLCILGPSGSGKTTLMSLLSGVLTPTEGELVVLHQDMGCLPDRTRANHRLLHMGQVFQDHNLIDYLTVFENILFPISWAGTPECGVTASCATERASNLLERLELSDKKHSLPSELSHGQCQRVTIARALILAPALILADEPTASLDSKLTSDIVELLLETPSPERCLVMATHDETLAEHFHSTILVERGPA